MRILCIFLLILLSGCSSIAPGHFSISINGAENNLSIGDTLFFSLSNPKEHRLNDLRFSLNGKPIDDQYTIIESFGNQRLVADFNAGDKPFSVRKQFVVFANKAPDIYTYKLLNTYPHDKNAYTQGLEFYQGVLYESTGQYGLSSIRKTAFATGEVIEKLPLDASYFGEGLTFINDEAVQLTWKENLGFIYDPNNFKLLRSFNYDKSKEGWGLCNDGTVVYKTDGTEKLWKLDPTTFEENGFVDIVTHNKLISKVNELEYANGLIYANTYQFNKEVVLIIKPTTGLVVGVVDFSGLKEQVTQHPQLDVFNGIAYHPKRNSFFVTGKYWDKLFEVEIFKEGMRHHKWVKIICLLIAIGLTKACDYDLSFYPAQTQDIGFSSDTVYLDTVFTTIGSSTYNLRIYNQSDRNIEIGSIRLGQGSDSQFRLNVDGVHGQDFNDVEILASDSIYVFIETTVDIKDYADIATEFLYNDQLLVDEHSVELITLVKDAIFLYPEQDRNGIKEIISFGTDDEGNELGIEGFYLEDDELVFTNERPYVIYGYAGVPPEKTVRFEAGARIHFHDNSGLIASQSSSVHILGEQSADPELQEGEVIFEGDRLEPFFENIPGQWGAIWLTAGSTNHIFRHATIKNASVGILMDYNDGTENPTLILEQTQIHNSSAVGLWAKTGHVHASNSIFGNAGNASFYGNIGGSYEFTHCTFANYWNRSFRSTPAVILNDYVPISETENFVMSLKKAVFANCIIDGNQTVEFGVEQKGDDELSFSLDHTVLRFSPNDDTIYENPYYDFTSPTLYPKLILNKQTAFYQPTENDFRISQESEVIGLGKNTHAANVPLDLKGIDRTITPDLGALQHVIFE